MHAIPAYIATHMARETNLNAGHSLLLAGLRDNTQKCGDNPANAGRLASMPVLCSGFNVGIAVSEVMQTSDHLSNPRTRRD